jgi:hypothetical protein
VAAGVAPLVLRPAPQLVDDLPVGPHVVDVGVAVRRPVGEVQQGQLLGQPGAEVLVDVDRLAGAQAADDQPVALGDRQLDQALARAVHALERRGGGDADQRAA